MENKNLEIIKEEAEKLLKLVKIEAGVEIKVDEEDVIHLSLQTEEAGIIIGYHGQTLSSLQLLFNLIIYKKLGQWSKIIFDVGDWRERREEYLKKMALNIAQRVEANGEPVACPYLTAAERRIIHLALQDNTKVITESQGEGENRRLFVKIKS